MPHHRIEGEGGKSWKKNNVGENQGAMGWEDITEFQWKLRNGKIRVRPQRVRSWEKGK